MSTQQGLETLANVAFMVEGKKQKRKKNKKHASTRTQLLPQSLVTLLQQISNREFWRIQRSDKGHGFPVY